MTEFIDPNLRIRNILCNRWKGRRLTKRVVKKDGKTSIIMEKSRAGNIQKERKAVDMLDDHNAELLGDFDAREKKRFDAYLKEFEMKETE